MCRHALPRLDLHIGQLAEHTAHFVASHPIASGVFALAPLGLGLGVLAIRGLRNPAAIYLDGSGHERVDHVVGPLTFSRAR